VGALMKWNRLAESHNWALWPSLPGGFNRTG